jgi:hypothetical protein
MPSDIAASVRLPTSEELKAHSEFHPEWFLFPNFIAVEFAFTWPDRIANLISAHAAAAGNKGKRIQEAASRRLANVGTSIAQRLIMLMSIASPGYSSSRFAVQKGDELFEEAGACHSWLDEAVEDKILQPKAPLTDFDPALCLSWGKHLPGLWSGLPQSNVQRAFSYLTYTFSRDYYSSPFDTVMWAIGALDAFYCDTSVGLSEKLKKRIPLLLPDLEKLALSKAINAIYADRSRTFHGDVKFVCNFFDPYHEIQHSDSHMELFKSIPTLYYILIRSFQFAVEKSATRVDFMESAVCAS